MEYAWSLHISARTLTICYNSLHFSHTPAQYRLYAVREEQPLTYAMQYCSNIFSRKDWFSNTSFTTGMKTLPTFQARFEALKKTRASGRNVGKVFNPVV